MKLGGRIKHGQGGEIGGAPAPMKKGEKAALGPLGPRDPFGPPPVKNTKFSKGKYGR